MAKAADPVAPAFSGTNVQEQGVDEPDTVKTDGRRIVTLTAGVLHVIDPATRRATGRLDSASPGRRSCCWPATTHSFSARPTSARPTRPRRAGRALARRPSPPPVSRPDRTRAGRPGRLTRVISRYRGDGQLVDARQTGSVARIVLSSTPQINFPLRATTPDGLARQNKAAIDATPISAWLPGWEITTGAATTRGRLGCGSVVHPATLSGTGLLTVLSLDLSATGARRR